MNLKRIYSIRGIRPNAQIGPSRPHPPNPISRHLLVIFALTALLTTLLVGFSTILAVLIISTAEIIHALTSLLL